MDIKKKFKSFVTRLDPSSPVDDLPPPVTADDPAIARFKEHLHVNDFQDPAIDREIIASIETQYMKDDAFDSSEYELSKLPEKLRMQEIDDDRNRLRRQLQAVSKKVSELVLENHPSYAAELQRVMELQGSLNTASVICANGRRHLAMAKQGFTTASLSLLANYRKRQQLMALLKSLRTIKTLQRTDIRLREMMEEEDYPGAIQLCLECQKAASTFRHYKCISELNSKLQDTLVMIEEQLDVALSKTCSNFDTTHYEKVQTAYRLLGKTQTAMDQLHMHFTSAIHNTAFTIVLGYVELTSGTGDSTFQKRQYNDLCGHITHDTFIPCLIDLCKALWEVMKSYHKTIQWHEQQDKDSCVTDAESSSSIEASFNRRYVQQKLEHGLARIWVDVQQKVKIYVSSTDLSHFKFDEFIQVLDLVNRLVKVGEEFCNSKSESLQESIRLQTSNYFKNYHRARLDELRMFLENEGWELCPVKSNFSLMQLQEFRFMRNRDVKKSLSQSSLQLNTSSSRVSYFERYTETGSPFDVQVEEEESEDVLEMNGFHWDGNDGSGGSDSDDDDVPDELKQDFIDEQTGEVPVKRTFNRRHSVKQSSGGKSAPIISNTTLTVLRIFGKYMQMMDILQTIAFDVVFCMSQLFDLYLYSVYSFFSNRQDEDQVLSSKLQTTLQRIRNSMILGETSGVDDSMVQIAQPHLCPAVDLSGVNSLNGLAERVVAVESLVFLSDQLTVLHPHLESSVPTTKRAFLQQFFSQTVSTAAEVRRPVYRGVTEQVIDDDMLLHQMTSVKWDIKDIMSQHSSYVDTLLRELQIFNSRLSEVSKRVPIPASATVVLWEHCVRLASKTFVDGYASAKKCTNEGRALMQLDFQQFLMTLEKLTTVRPIPGRELVEGYIKAYYLPEAQLEVWMKEKKEYSPRQLLSLVNCVPHINRKGRQRLQNLIEDPDKSLKKDNLLDFSFPKINKIS